MYQSTSIIIFLKNWNKKFGENFWIYCSLTLLFIFWMLLDLFGRSPENRNFFWLSQESSRIPPIFTFYMPVIVLSLIIITILLDFLAYCFRRLDNFTNVDEWNISGQIALITRTPPDTEEKAAKAEMELLKELFYDIKYLLLKLSFRILLVMTVFILSFSEIYAFINRVSVCPPAYCDIPWNAGLPWHIFYSLDVMTTLGGAAPTPHAHNVLIWWGSGFELAFSIVLTILFFTLAITCIFETFNLKTSYIPAFVKYNLEKAKNHKEK